MVQEMVIGIPGPWDRASFVQSVVGSTKSEFMFAGRILVHLPAQDHVELDFDDFFPQMVEAFRIAGQEKISQETLAAIALHKGIAYLHFPLELLTQQTRISKFTGIMQQIGGYAIKVESSGIAHEWKRWFSLINSNNPFDTYCAVVVLTGDNNDYYSCGMHHFGLPESQVSRAMPIQEAADLLNRFNYYQIEEKPNLASGHTFSLTADSRYYRIKLLKDYRHPDDDLFHNPFGVWNLDAI